MAIGDDAVSEGYPKVPNTGAGAEVKYGGQEITRTRDFVAQVKRMIKTKAAARATAGLLSGTTDPASGLGDDGDWYAKII